MIYCHVSVSPLMSVIYPVQTWEREHIGELIHQSLVPEGHSDVGDVGPLHVVAGDPREVIVGTEPVLLGVVREPGLEDGVTGDLTEVAAKSNSCLNKTMMMI